MKNLFLFLAFMVIGTFAFANSNVELENSNASNLVTANFEDLSVNDYIFSFNGNQLSHSELLSEKECTLRGKFTITFEDGTSISWEGTLTIVGQTCTEFLKEMMAQ